MFKNYLKTAWRNLAKQKGLTFINVFGLSVGIACFSLFMLYAVNELNYDNFHKNGSNIYRVYQWYAATPTDDEGARPYNPMPLGPAMKADLPGVENYMRFLDNWGKSFIKTPNGVLREEVSFADADFFTFFSFKLKYGNPATALQNLQSIVLTETEAEKLYGKANAVGETLQIQEDGVYVPFTVTAVAEDVPSNSSVRFNMVGNFNYFATTPQGKKGVGNWNRIAYATFLQLKPGSTLKGNKTLLADFRKKYYPNEEVEARKNGYTGKGPSTTYGLQPIADMHTNTFIDSDAAVDTKSIWLLLAIAAGVLLIACINFTTLAIGRSAGRSKDVGVRKVIGGSKKTLVAQFLTESVVLALLSAIMGLILLQILLPLFNTLSGRNLHFSVSQFPQLVWLMAGLVLLVGILAGSYPALVMARFKPIEVLKTKIKIGGGNFFTKALVTLQFTVSAGLIISTAIIMQQLHYMQTKNPGFNKENVVDIDVRGIKDAKKLYPLFKQSLAANPGVAGTTRADMGLGEGTGFSQTSFKYKDKQKTAYEYSVDADYLRVLGIQLIEGRNFNPAITSDTTTSVIINEALMNDFGWTTQNAIGQKLSGYFDDVNDPKTPVVIGVVKNIDFRNLKQKVPPQMFHQFPYGVGHFFVRLRPGDPSKTLAAIQDKWKTIAADYPFKYNFIDENFNRFYQSEARWSNIVGWAGGISIFLACLGLFGLVALASVNRTKEIGIRKVLGASVSSIMQLLSADFLKLIVTAFVIATPLAWYFMSKWLEDYANRINIEWWVFAITGIAIVVIALITICVQAIKAALANPVKSLRTE